MTKLGLIFTLAGLIIVSGSATVHAQPCGDGVISGVEFCDDQFGTGGLQFAGNLNCADGVFDYGTMGCDASCMLDYSGCYYIGEGPVQLCGNGVFEAGEECDGQGFCSGDCKCDLGANLCGDGCLEGTEECDAATSNSDFQPDGCRTNCEWYHCGDNVTDTGEDCDDGTSNSDTLPDACRTDCSAPGCGDGVVDVLEGEECDDSVANSDAPGANCSLICLVPRCGNDYMDGGELCDDGNTTAGDGCSADCLSLEECGNSIVDQAAGETCDDGNLVDDDGCSSVCLIEGCGNDLLETGELCDDGNVVSGDGCSADCQSLEECGNGIVDQAAGETCDDGNLVDDDGCSSICLIEGCGDGAISGFEECDDGNTLADDGCSPLCSLETGWSCEDEPSDCSAVESDPTDEDPDDDDEIARNPSTGGSCSTLGTVGSGGASFTWFLLLALFPLMALFPLIRRRL